MSKKRERLEIIYDILRAIRDKGKDAKPTHILYKSNLSHDMLKDYLKELLDKDFITEETDKKNRTRYNLKEKGFNYLKEYAVIKSFTESYGLG